MKPFDIDKAKSGIPVCTKDGYPARIICYDRITSKNDNLYPIVALITKDGSEQLQTFTKEGRNIESCISNDDLMLDIKQHEGWINIYPDGYDDNKYTTSTVVYPSREKAIEVATIDRITTLKIEWEENP